MISGQLWMKATRPPLTKCERYLGWASAHPPWSSTGPDRPLFFHLAVTDRVHERNRLCSTQDTGSELTMGTWDKNRCVTCCCVLIVCEKQIEAVGRGSCPRMLPVQRSQIAFSKAVIGQEATLEATQDVALFHTTQFRK